MVITAVTVAGHIEPILLLRNTESVHPDVLVLYARVVEVHSF